jgi:hypothetical protein
MTLFSLTVKEWHFSNLSYKTISYTTKGLKYSKRCHGYVMPGTLNVDYVFETTSSFALFFQIILKFRAKFSYMAEKLEILYRGYIDTTSFR